MVEIIRAKGAVGRRMRGARGLTAGALKRLAFRPAFEEPEVKHGRAEALRRGLKIAGRDIEHVEKLDYIPAHFVLQWHGWGEPEFLKSLGARGRGKGHYDLRIQKLTAPTWFGITLFSDPTKAPTKGERHLGTVKGYEQLVWGPGKPAKHALPSVRKKGLESMGEMKWMSFEGTVRPGGPGNPTRNLWSRMKIIDEGPAVLHRRELDFVDVTLIGDRLRGRWFHRLVKGATKEEREDPERGLRQRKAVRWYFWRQKNEPAGWVRKMLPIALRKQTLPLEVSGGA